MAVMAFMLMFNVSSLPLMFYVMGFLGTCLPLTVTVVVWFE